MQGKQIVLNVLVILGLAVLFLTLYIVSKLTYRDIETTNPPIPVVEPIWKIQEKDGFKPINLSSASTEALF